ncbi:amidohydrolase [Paramyrothecium foliicola]|nr:amidohydrolase [Paramyrothecium foliicola]
MMLTANRQATMAPSTRLSLLFAVSSFFVSGVVSSQSIADTVFRNGSIYSLNDRSSKYQALAIKDGYITFLGSDGCVKPFIGPDTAVFDLEGRMAMPGLVDAHMHLVSGGAGLLKCNLNYQPLTLQQILDHVQGCLDAEPEKTKDDWLDVLAMDYYTLTDLTGGVSKKELDTLKTERPIVIHSADRHSHWVNTIALEASDITASSSNPPGGIIERVPGSQEPSGILQDNAVGLLSGPAPATPEEDIESTKAALKLLREEGVTSFQDAASNAAIARAFEAVKEEGGLSARGYFDWRIDAPSSAAEIAALVEEVINSTTQWNDPAELGPAPSLKWQAVKIYVDGVILYPANTGALIEPYFQPIGNTSEWAPNNGSWPEPYWSTEILSATLEALITKGIDAQIHVDGDMAVRVALDSLEIFREKHGDKYDYRVGLAHNEVTDPSDWPRYAELKADPIMSFQWAQASSVWYPNTVKSMGPVRSNYLQAWGDIAKFGTRVVYGSDWPIDPLDEWLAVKASVTRSGDPTNPNSPASQGAPYDGPGLPGLSLTREEAIRAITIESSRFLRADDHIGSLEVGKLADIIVLQANYFEVPDDELARQKSLLTMVGGEVVYIADGVDFGNGVVPKFPNNGTLDQKLEKKNIGGIQGRSLSQEGREAVQRLSVRNVCDHGIAHTHKH